MTKNKAYQKFKTRLKLWWNEFKQLAEIVIFTAVGIAVIDFIVKIFE